MMTRVRALVALVSYALDRAQDASAARWETVAAFLGRHGRVAIYGGSLALVAAYAALQWSGQGHGERGWRALGYALACLYETIGVQAIRSNRSYHPAYKLEKALGSGALALIAVGLLLTTGDGASANAPLIWTWLALLVGTKMIAMEFIFWRNRRPRYEVRQVVKTTEGPMVLPSRANLRLMGELVAGAARHDDLDADIRELLKADLGYPSRGEIAEDLRRQFHRLRERKAREVAVRRVDTELLLGDTDVSHPDERG